MLMVFHGVNGCAECDGKERGKKRRGGDYDNDAFWFNLRRGRFWVIFLTDEISQWEMR